MIRQGTDQIRNRQFATFSQVLDAIQICTLVDGQAVDILLDVGLVFPSLIAAGFQAFISSFDVAFIASAAVPLPASSDSQRSIH